MRNTIILVVSIFLFSMRILHTQSQTDSLQIRSAAFFSDEDHIQLAVSLVDSQAIEIYINNALITTLAKINPNASRITNMDWNSTGDLLAVIESPGRGIQDYWYIWDKSRNERIIEQPLDFVTFLAWHPFDPYRVVVGTGVEIIEINVVSNTLRVAPRIFTNIWEVEWSASGDYLAVLDDQGRVYLMSDTNNLSIAFEIDENVPLPERQDFYFDFSWSPFLGSTQFAVYDMLDTEIEIWDFSTGTSQTTFATFDTSLQHAEGILWTPIGLAGYVNTGDIALYNPETGQVIDNTHIEHSTFFWDEPRQRFLYISNPVEPTQIRLENLLLGTFNRFSKCLYHPNCLINR